MELSRRQLVAGMIAGGGLAALPIRAQAPGVILFRDVSLVDGTGAPPRPANVLVAGDRIARITRPSAADRVANARIVEGGGRVLAPGFIDLHTHGDPLTSSYETFLAMGVTTISLGQDGGGPVLRAGIRLQRLARDDGPRGAGRERRAARRSRHDPARGGGCRTAIARPDAAQLRRMTALLDAELRAGMFGLSYGLEYVPGHLLGDARAGRSGPRRRAARPGRDEPYALGE